MTRISGNNDFVTRQHDFDYSNSLSICQSQWSYIGIGKRFFLKMGTFLLQKPSKRSVPAAGSASITLLGLLLFLVPWNGVYGQACSNISGTWDVTETVTILNTIDGKSQRTTETATDTIEMVQDGCTIRYVRTVSLPGGEVFQTQRAGRIDGDEIRLSGEAAETLEGGICTRNSFTAVGRIAGDKIELVTTVDVHCSHNGSTQSITGNGTAVFVRPPPKFAIWGEVREEMSDGPPIEGVLLQLTGGENTLTALTDAAGRYRFDGLDGDVRFRIDPVKSGWVFNPDGLNVVPSQSSELPLLVAYREVNPVLVGSHDTSGDTTNLALSKGVAYVADDSGGLVVLDISNPIHPTLLGSYDIVPPAGDVAVLGSYAFVAFWRAGMRVLDLSELDNPIEKGFVMPGDRAIGVTVSGDYAYVADGSAGLQVIDIKDPTVPSLVGRYAAGGFVNSVVVSGDLAYIANGNSGLTIVDINDPTNPSHMGSNAASSHARFVTVSGDHAFVADINGGLKVIDVRDPKEPTLVGSYNTVKRPVHVTISGKHAFMSNVDEGLVVINISDPTNPVRVGSFDAIDRVRSAQIAGNLIYLASGKAGLQILSIADSEVTGSIRLTGPNGGESLRVGGVHQIQWSSNEVPGSEVRIELLKGDAGALTIVARGLNNGTYDWVVPASVSIGVDYKIRVCSVSDSSICDDSDDSFVITQTGMPADAVDSDDDGMPDDWEDLHGLNKSSLDDASWDTDGDGASNIDEFRTGTHPGNMQSYFKLNVLSVVRESNGDVTLLWNSAPGFEFFVEGTTELGGLWSEVKNSRRVASSFKSSFTFPSMAGASSEFYRVVGIGSALQPKSTFN